MLNRLRCLLAIWNYHLLKYDTHTATFDIKVYFMRPNHCAVVTDEGQDVNGNVSNIIAAHGICSLWTQNEKEIK